MEPHECIAEAVEAARHDLIAFLQSMVQLASLPDREHAVQNLVAQKLRSMGLEVEIVPSNFEDLRHHPAFGDDGFSPTDRINVVGRWVGSQRDETKSLILNGHVDVVPVGDLSLWDDSPWSGAIHDGKLYGRGSCDMKAGLCTGIFAVDVLQRLRYQPANDVLIESVIGEESGGIGTLTTNHQGIYRRGGHIAGADSPGDRPRSIGRADVPINGAWAFDPCRDEALWRKCHRKI